MYTSGTVYIQAHVFNLRNRKGTVPTYEYECRSCGYVFERIQSFSADPITECPRCGQPVRKVIHPVGIVFKGSGWYKNDSRPSSSTASTSDTAANTDGAKANGAAAAAGSDSKSGSAAAASGSEAKSSSESKAGSGDAKPKSESKSSSSGSSSSTSAPSSAS
jgi:putative FmdB family regulatory protein